ncbi:MAG TPA: TVP38/TMEM64 family protein [Gammaproteobacteria bacterium]|nr:TVP38/TMEM64 family protein [Gammaproteobacteria bacterium]
MRRDPKPLILLVALLALLAVAALSPIRPWLLVGVDWAHGHPRSAWLAFILTYALAAVLAVPGSILTLGAGFVFGLEAGAVLVSIGSIVGAAGAFLVARHCVRDWLLAKFSGSPRFRALDAASRHHGFLIVLLARLSPILPFNLMNYGLGVTNVSFRDFVVASWIGMLPITCLYVYVGSAAKSMTELAAGVGRGPGTLWLVAGGLVAAAALTVVVARKANDALAYHLAADSTEAEGRS